MLDSLVVGVLDCLSRTWVFQPNFCQGRSLVSTQLATSSQLWGASVQS